MAQAAAKRMTVDEFLAWCPEDDGRWELVDGQPAAMAPTTDAHGIILMTLGARMSACLADRPQCTLRTGVGLAAPDRDDTLFIPDLMISCRPVEPERRFIREPLVVAEILSPSTGDMDRYVKLPAYRQVSGIQEIVLVHPVRLYAEVHRRLEGDRWLVDLVQGPEARLRLESIGLDVALADIYAGVPLDEAEGA
jgi:Uma2 family endonuclease